ncbi:1,4-dihydroxy-2-naphthoate polyprenyltransferase [Herbiconiux sp. L3-i23]|uniref:1,4-dihydroxy-2-naphthoate polyprenyltransferase n=1 Tax=Herbiconiux sp. L3-i23 TaxID=2905871 RepID=UPI0020508930|nr:1,4-dihydroxy-2-naphthoate polyprenyltransferase [Herbiconiux sp. L3-i23]BDI21361.1 1,4-dihydroxy-2-naphthoate octaprenyltransferase [Herbiconiux sp. L3-i23]
MPKSKTKKRPARKKPQHHAPVAGTKTRTAPRSPRAARAGIGGWIGAARPRTLTLAVAPVALGTGAAYLAGGAVWHEYRILLCLAVAVLLQIGVNFANDYSDGVRGTDKHRVGPARITASGAAKPRTVLTVALVFFALAALAGLALVLITQLWWLLAVGAVAIAAAWFYTGGKRPYGYAGLGELSVFVFFGLVATIGTTYVQIEQVPTESWLSAIGIGLLACAVLVVNNMRDIEQDRIAGKRTLSVLIGLRWSRILFCVLLGAPFVIVGFFSIFYPLAILVFFALLLAVPAGLIAVTARTAKELVLSLSLTSILALVYGVGLGAAFAF